MINAYQAKYFAYDLTKKSPYNHPEKIGQSLVSASVDLNPHQVTAALFALDNPLSRGVILADEVGLGKTIEAGLVISQMWAEGKRSILIIAPKSLRHQWQDELRDHFHLESMILDGARYRKTIKKKESDPLQESEKIIITNEHFVAGFGLTVKKHHWDLVIIDEAHKLRNVWRKGENQAKRAKAIREALDTKNKLLLTATPMQNNLMELFGLVSFLDDHILGTPESFNSSFVNIPSSMREEKLLELKSRLKDFFHRELRKNVREYIQYTDRNTVTFTYAPTDEESRLRVGFEEFLRRPVIVSIPHGALALVKLIYLKLLASSSFALKNSLINIYKRLCFACVDSNNEDLFDELLSKIRNELTVENRATIELEQFEEALFKGVYPKTFEELKNASRESIAEELDSSEEEIKESYTESDDFSEDIGDDETSQIFPVELIKEESELIIGFIKLSRSISENRKANALIEAINQQFTKAKEEGWPQKAVVFTEFKTTQKYVLEALKGAGIDPETDVVVFNGGSGDADQRRDLVNQFKEEKKIFLTTEAGAEGLNLQFCNLLINYDLPWNPQRIEQRIGRCHRYGQKLDVIVVNFVNTKNYADVRVLELLTNKFKLFKGAFGASDEVLGQIESGTDVEKEIFKIYLECRTEEEIKNAFDQLQESMRDQIDEKMEKAKSLVLETFDDEVQKHLNLQHEEAKSIRDEFTAKLWSLLHFSLSEHGRFDETNLSIEIDNSPTRDIPCGTYILRSKEDKNSTKEHYPITLGSPITKLAINTALEAPTTESIILVFKLSEYNGKISALEQFIGESGALECWYIEFESLRKESHLLPIFVTSSGSQIPLEYALKMFKIPVDLQNTENLFEAPEDTVDSAIGFLSLDVDKRNQENFNDEIERLDTWSEDVKNALDIELRSLDKEISQLKKEAKQSPSLDLKVKSQKKIKNKESLRNRKRRNLFEEQDKIEQEKDLLLGNLESRIKPKIKQKRLFKANWRLV